MIILHPLLLEDFSIHYLEEEEEFLRGMKLKNKIFVSFSKFFVTLLYNNHTNPLQKFASKETLLSSFLFIQWNGNGFKFLIVMI